MIFTRVFKILLIVIIAFAFATIATAYAAGNTVPTGNAGDGSGAVSGYVVSNVHYTLNAANPANVDNVSFTVAPAVAAGGSVQVQLDGSAWLSTCTVTGGTNVSCNLTGVTALSVSNLRVVAAQ